MESESVLFAWFSALKHRYQHCNKPDEVQNPLCHGNYRVLRYNTETRKTEVKWDPWWSSSQEFNTSYLWTARDVIVENTRFQSNNNVNTQCSHPASPPESQWEDPIDQNFLDFSPLSIDERDIL